MNIHILAICGGMTAPLAVALKKQGHNVTGSDQEKIYPPFSVLLKKAKIPVNSKNIHPDLYIIGSGYKNQSTLVTEFDNIKKTNIPYISATQYIAKNIIKQNSILIAGSYGKSSTTAMTAYLLNNTKYKPSYFFAAQPKNKISALKINNTDWSICEADESINGLDTQAKFLYYPVKYLILTSVQWEHKESYKTKADNLNAFKKLIEKLPKDGLLIYNQKEQGIIPLLKYAKCQVIPYNGTKVNHPYLFGSAFENNFSAVKTLCNYLNISTAKILKFKGLKHRLELYKKTKNNILFYSDFGQSGIRIKTTLDDLKLKYPNFNIKVILEPHAGFLQYKSSIIELSKAFVNVNQIFLTKLFFTKNSSKNLRISFNHYKQIFNDKIIYLPITKDLIKTVVSSLKSKDILIRFSSGGREGQNAFYKIISYFP